MAIRSNTGSTTAVLRHGPDWTILAALSFAGMIVAILQSMVVPILGELEQDLHTTAPAISWVVTANLLAAAVFTPLLGRFGDQHGKRKTLLGCLLMVVVGSLVAATTTSLPLLIFGRVLQGAASGVFPLAISMLRDEIPPAKLSGSMALVSATLGIGGGLGLVVTGLLSRGGGNYHNVFWLTLVLSVLAFVGVVTLVPESPVTTPGRTDFAGAATLGATLICLLVALSEGDSWGWGSAATLGCLAGAVVMGALWAWVERRVVDPLVNMEMFLYRPVLLTNIAALLLGFAMFGWFIGDSDFVQMPRALVGYGFGASVLRAAVVYLLPGSLTMVVAAPVGGMLVRTIGARVVLALGGLFGVIGFTIFTLWHSETWTMIVAGMVVASGVGFAYAAMPSLIVAAVPRHQTGIANAINTISRSVGASVAGAAIASLLAARHLPNSALPQESGFTLTFVASGLCCGIAALLVMIGLSPQMATAEIPVSARDTTPLSLAAKSAL